MRPYFEGVDLKEPILDAGCGTGYFADILCNRGYKVSGIDLNGQLENNDKFDFKQVDIIKFETDKKFETILLINILATASPDDRLKIFFKIKELKTEDGIAYVINTCAKLFGSDFDSESLSGHKTSEGRVKVRVELINGEFIEFEDYLVTEEEIKEMCAAVGLRIIEKKDFKPEELEKPIYELYLLE